MCRTMDYIIILQFRSSSHTHGVDSACVYTRSSNTVHKHHTSLKFQCLSAPANETAQQMSTGMKAKKQLLGIFTRLLKSVHAHHPFSAPSAGACRKMATDAHYCQDTVPCPALQQCPALMLRDAQPGKVLLGLRVMDQNNTSQQSSALLSSCRPLEE